ncbi:DUF1707 SHOCT-like domain-containing protein [Actinokineospora fastidiosa]|uniref:DUF1707 domain-containing protein n=1 Tax=Actinokineospora fastidiosa TaxID=1816 RepID=A0A918LAR2_9PSEU|nr:DUF1707 domain-containing protein [Actinokineospora fastidiosa]GGS25135.1 hypothetical protein GCM10010171_18000 [Actinokineospora fastidiosa]
MSPTPWQDLRVGDAERESALRSLGDHMAAGRLSVDEYGERSAHVATARTRGDIAALFADLPEPRPLFGQAPAPLAPPPPPPARRASDLVLPVVAVGLVLVGALVFRFFPPFLLIPLVIFLVARGRSQRWR